MAVEGVPLDDKAKRTRDLLSSFYSHDPSSQMSANASASARFALLDAINTASFDADQYMNLLIQKSNLEGLLQKHVEMAAEIKNLDTDLQMLVYENYNKFISATETIKRMKNNIVGGMESNMEDLLDKIVSVQSKSDIVNTSLFEKREHIEKLHRTRNLLRKVQFIYDLPTRLGKCIKTEAYADAVRFYTGAMPIFKVYGDSSFQDCKRASEEAIITITENLKAKLFSDSEPVELRAEAVLLLKQLDVPVENLKDKLIEKLDRFLIDFELQSSIHEFVEAVRALCVIFPDSEKQLSELARDLITKHFKTVEDCIKRRISSEDLLAMLRIIWINTNALEEVLPEATLSSFSLEAAHVAIKQYISTMFSHLLHDISETLTRVQTKPKEGVGAESTLQASLEGSKRAVLQGSMDVLLDFRRLLDDNIELLVKLRDFIVDWVQEGFQNFFRMLDSHFLMLSGRNKSVSLDHGMRDGSQGEKVFSGLVLVLAQLSVFVEQNAIPRITEEIAASFSGGGVRGYEYGPAFIPGEICRMFRSAGEKFLHLYVNIKTQKVSNLLRKRFTTPNWVKHKEPREVHMFVDLLLQELGAIGTEVQQILPHGIRKHRRSDSNGSTASSRSNPIREDRITRSNAQRARSQLLETHLAKLFKQKMEIFTKVDYTQESVISTIMKLCLKSLQEFVRLQTFSRSGFQQIQLDIQFLKTPLKEIVEDEGVIDFLLDEVIVASAERCLDPIPLEAAILDKLIQAKLGKSKEKNAVSQEE
ncbi:hypothetical protein Sjap_018984 [Stephania japonica]|uniref:Vacuolar protein sorting-associated protein 51 homolog n=1 Tax=Stephania japonica TaxID=461633 RepID=A0AAP0HZ35_9MAGN